MNYLKNKSIFLNKYKNIFSRDVTFIDLICNKRTLKKTGDFMIQNKTPTVLKFLTVFTFLIAVFSSVSWSVDLEEGCYIIRNRGGFNAPLALADKKLTKGKGVQLLTRRLENYLPNTSQRSHILWDIFKAGNSTYIIRNRDLSAPLTRADEISASGHFAALLQRGSDHILWNISKDESGSYIIRNKGYNDSCLTWTFEESANGPLVQLLQTGLPTEGESSWDINHILWDFERVQENGPLLQLLQTGLSTEGGSSLGGKSLLVEF